MKLANINGRVGIITSYRSDANQDENRFNWAKLISILSKNQLYTTRFTGKWGNSAEPALMVSGISLELLKELGEKFRQDAVAYCGPETSDVIKLINLRNVL